MSTDLTTTTDEEKTYSATLAKSNLLPAEFRGNPANIFWALQRGKSLGLPADDIITGVHVIKGKPTLSVELMNMLVRRAGHKLYVEATETGASCTITRKDDPEHPITMTYTVEDAKRMGLAGNDNWRKQPKVMCMNRAISQCVRIACPDAIHGMGYTPDEIAETVTVASVEETPRAKSRDPYSAYKTEHHEHQQPADDEIFIEESSGEIIEADEE